MKIEKGIDINEYSNTGIGWGWVKAMDVGDSVLITDKVLSDYPSHWDKVRIRVELLRAMNRIGMKGKSRSLPCGSIRVWRVK